MGAPAGRFREKPPPATSRRLNAVTWVHSSLSAQRGADRVRLANGRTRKGAPPPLGDAQCCFRRYYCAACAGGRPRAVAATRHLGRAGRRMGRGGRGLRGKLPRARRRGTAEAGFPTVSRRDPRITSSSSAGRAPSMGRGSPSSCACCGATRSSSAAAPIAASRRASARLSTSTLRVSWCANAAGAATRPPTPTAQQGDENVRAHPNPRPGRRDAAGMRGRHSISYKPARENRGVQNETGAQSEAALASGRKTAQTILAPNDGCFRRVVRRDFLRLRKPARDDSKRESCRRPRDLPVRLTRGERKQDLELASHRRPGPLVDRVGRGRMLRCSRSGLPGMLKSCHGYAG
jgi:hypothetical protein